MLVATVHFCIFNPIVAISSVLSFLGEWVVSAHEENQQQFPLCSVRFEVVIAPYWATPISHVYQFIRWLEVAPLGGHHSELFLAYLHSWVSQFAMHFIFTDHIHQSEGPPTIPQHCGLPSGVQWQSYSICS